MVLGKLIGSFVAIIVGVALVPTVADGVHDATVNASGGAAGVTNVTGAAFTILGLTTLFFALGVTTVAIAAAALGLREAGIM